MQILGVDAVDRRQRAAEHVVAAAELVGALERDHVARLLDDAEHVGVAAVVLADPAERLGREVEADLALPDLLLDLADRVGERERLLVGDRSRWNAIRCAVRCPTPGKRDSSVIRRLIGGASTACGCLPDALADPRGAPVDRAGRARPGRQGRRARR